MHDLGFFYLVERLAAQAEDDRAQVTGRTAAARSLRNGWLPLALAGALAAATAVAAARARRT
ncbi:hypothetical protein [Streptomyces candidus]|uniref:Uncharacterized protein n=1 Tax=Streptomyces candidus TaxID=67283 RepID=A0A7X0LRX2_9ACTN|nr:hypothetical protein [Streptomyces candidus]MBB6438552.1 hypothetical protein [Streptomyces candidus]GHH45490.1 hypothetical protein GCM10018773_35000 [Streptomyces candidus]